MSDLSREHRAELRDLSLGPIPWGFWSWTWHDGSTWVCRALDGSRCVGWAAITWEQDVIPVIGVFVSKRHRGHGLATELLKTLIKYLRATGHLASGDSVAASTERFAKYEKLCESLGLRCYTWK